MGGQKRQPPLWLVPKGCVYTVDFDVTIGLALCFAPLPAQHDFTTKKKSFMVYTACDVQEEIALQTVAKIASKIACVNGSSVFLTEE